MSAVERIEAAITKLEKLKCDRGYFQYGEWLAAFVNSCTCGGADQYGHPAHEPGCGSEPITNDDLFVTLHRTIDPQLAILRDAINALPVYPDWLVTYSQTAIDLWALETTNAVTLADAILGDPAA